MIDVFSNLPEVIILCGGKGERLRPITNDVPKPLVKINNKPILHYVIEHLMQFDIGNINIAGGYKSDTLKSYFSDNKYDINIDIYDSGDVDIIKRIQDILSVVKKDVIVLYGDTISNVNIADLIFSHRKSSKDITMTVWPLKLAYGLVEITKDGTVESFTEKPTLDKWINIGYFCMNKCIREFILSHVSFESFLLEAVNRKSVNAYKHEGLHITVNTLRDLEEAQSNIKSVIKG